MKLLVFIFNQPKRKSKSKMHSVNKTFTKHTFYIVIS